MCTKENRAEGIELGHTLTFPRYRKSWGILRLDIQNAREATPSLCAPMNRISTMKRKLNEDDVPTAINTATDDSSTSTFNALGLDARLLQAVAKENFLNPTLVQSKAIPLALEGKDILGMSDLKA